MSEDAIHGDSDFMPVEHTFTEGCYVREIFIPAGMMLTGKIHKHAHPNFLLEGEVTMITEEGGTVHMSAPQSLISPAGCKRAIFTHTDVRWTTVHVTDAKTPEDAEKEVIAKDYNEFIKYIGGEK